MATVFCCPSCGTNLRVNPATALLVSCPSCGEAVRVPRAPHPVESGPSEDTFPTSRLLLVRKGLFRLRLSLASFFIAGGFAISAVMVKLLALRLEETPPEWLAYMVFGLTVGWVALAGLGCWLRYRGYHLCNSAAAVVGVEGWGTTAMWGTLFSMLGVVSLGPCLLGRPFLPLPVMWLAIVLIGLVFGVFGLLLEFSFLTVLHRLFWEVSGWQAASRTGQYVVSFVFSVVGGLGCLCVGGLMMVLFAGGQAAVVEGMPKRLELTFELRLIGLATLATAWSCVMWATWRYQQLIVALQRVLAEPSTIDHPEPKPNNREV